MILNSFNNNFLKKEIVLFFILYFSLLVGFFLNENSTGGALLDYIKQKQISQTFSQNFFYTLLNYDEIGTRHSPILIIFLSFFEKFNLNDHLIRIFHLHLCLLLPLFFYLCLRIKFENVNKTILVLLTGLIFLSPTFRSLSIWPDSRILGLSIFCVSIYFYLKFEKEKKFLFALTNIAFYALASYISPNFAVFSLFFLYKYFYFINFKSLNFLIIILLNIILAFPAIYYIFILDINFLNKPAAIGISNNENIFFRNIFNQLLIIPTIVFFYIFPFFIIKLINFPKIIESNTIIIATILFLFSIYFFDYKYEYTGGGIFFKISYFLFKNNILFYCFSLISLIFLIKISKLNFENTLITLILFLSNPQITIYHKYFDPLIIMITFLLFKFDIKFNKIKNLKKFSFIYIYFSFFLLLNFIKPNV
tara:strand:- start:373 stop:1635 length:1263 start_codon:yes stop_codon:yes gene_type:complete